MSKLMEIMEEVKNNRVKMTSHKNWDTMCDLNVLCKKIETSLTENIYFIWGCCNTGTQMFFLNSYPEYFHNTITKTNFLEILKDNIKVLQSRMEYNRVNIFFSINTSHCDLEYICKLHDEIIKEQKKDVISDEFYHSIMEKFNKLDIEIIKCKLINDTEYSEYNHNMYYFIDDYRKKIDTIIANISYYNMEYYKMVFKFSLEEECKQARKEYENLNNIYLDRITYGIYDAYGRKEFVNTLENYNV